LFCFLPSSLFFFINISKGELNELCGLLSSYQMSKPIIFVVGEGCCWNNGNGVRMCKKKCGSQEALLFLFDFLHSVAFLIDRCFCSTVFVVPLKSLKIQEKPENMTATFIDHDLKAFFNRTDPITMKVHFHGETAFLVLGAVKKRLVHMSLHFKCDKEEFVVEQSGANTLLKYGKFVTRRKYKKSLVVGPTRSFTFVPAELRKHIDNYNHPYGVSACCQAFAYYVLVAIGYQASDPDQVMRVNNGKVADAIKQAAIDAAPRVTGAANITVASCMAVAAAANGPLRATYGGKDVTDLVIKHASRDGRFRWPGSPSGTPGSYNAIFGDPQYGVVKTLLVTFANGSHISINENSPADFAVDGSDAVAFVPTNRDGLDALNIDEVVDDSVDEDKISSDSDNDPVENEKNSNSNNVSSPAASSGNSRDLKFVKPQSNEEAANELLQGVPAPGAYEDSPQLGFEAALGALFSLQKTPENRPDLKVPTPKHLERVLTYINDNLNALKQRSAVQVLIANNKLTDDDIRVLFMYKIEDPYPVYRWLNGWLMTNRRDKENKDKVGPIFTLLYRAMAKLPLVTSTCAAVRAVVVRDIPALKNTFENFATRLASGSKISFWGFASFSTDDKVCDNPCFLGEPNEPAIRYRCGELTGVEMDPFTPEGMDTERELLPLCPCVFEVNDASIMLGTKLTVSVKQLDHSKYSYV
jgi:hypothetical protein